MEWQSWGSTWRKSFGQTTEASALAHSILGGQMKTLLAGLALLGAVSLTACENRADRDTGRVESADTSVTTRTTQDTTIVTADTTVDVDVDTTVKEGDVKRSGTAAGRDTARSH